LDLEIDNSQAIPAFLLNHIDQWRGDLYEIEEVGFSICRPVIRDLYNG
jgi:hypothetical protein